jgi:Raf kinase inhibitor-like YbhB/YbcL family protein
MKISSPSFEHNGMIPVMYTCDGDDVNPPLTIKDIPADTKSMILIVENPDSLLGNQIRWVVFDIPVTHSIEENSIPGIQGYNSFEHHDYEGPCPLNGVDRYIFKVYAVDSMIGASDDIHAGELLHAAEGHILDKAEMAGRYGKFVPARPISLELSGKNP